MGKIWTDFAKAPGRGAPWGQVPVGGGCLRRGDGGLRIFGLLIRIFVRGCGRGFIELIEELSELVLGIEKEVE